jgi:uncharacterized protein involved in type VI secretion and phage assembly
VLRNDDPQGLGRVQVEFPFARDMRSETWMRVMTPDAGSSDKVSKNRGMTCIPEKGDQVMVGFEFGDPNRPYVMGSMFHGKSGGGGGAGNNVKSIRDKTGSELVLNNGSLHIKDKSGIDSIITLDGEGNIIINSQESIAFSCGQSSINMDKDGNISMKGTKIYISGSDEVNIGSGSGEEGAPASGMSLTPDSVNIGAETTTTIAAGTELSVGSKTINICAEGGDVIVQGTKINLN